MLGKALGLHQSLLDSIQMGGYNPTRCKREMFKNWLKVKSESVSWQSLLIALREMGATDVATVVQKEYGISSSSDTEEVRDEVDAGFVEDVDVVKTTALGERSTVQHELLDKQLEYEKPSMSSVVESSGYQTTDAVLTDDPENSTEPTELKPDAMLIESVYSLDSVYSPESSTSSDQYHSLDSTSATMVSGTFTSAALSEGTLPSLERRSSPVSRTSPDTTPLSDTLSPHMSTPMERTLSEKYSPSPFSFQAEV